MVARSPSREKSGSRPRGGRLDIAVMSLSSVVPNNDLEAMISMLHIGCQSSSTLMTIVKFRPVHDIRRTVKAGVIWPIGEEEYHACLSRKRTPVQIWYGSPSGSIAQLVRVHDC